MKWQDEMADKRQKDPSNKRWSLWLASVVFLMLSALLVGPYLGLHPKSLLNGHNEPQKRDQVAIPLHPHLHSNRIAKTLRFDWTVTTGIRTPDGVEKQVYLVNGMNPKYAIHTHNQRRKRKKIAYQNMQANSQDQPLKLAQVTESLYMFAMSFPTKASPFTGTASR